MLFARFQSHCFDLTNMRIMTYREVRSSKYAKLLNDELHCEISVQEAFGLIIGQFAPFYWKFYSASKYSIRNDNNHNNNYYCANLIDDTIA